MIGVKWYKMLQNDKYIDFQEFNFRKFTTTFSSLMKIGKTIHYFLIINIYWFPVCKYLYFRCDMLI